MSFWKIQGEVHFEVLEGKDQQPIRVVVEMTRPFDHDRMSTGLEQVWSGKAKA